MKVTKELKDLITRHFDEKINAVRKSAEAEAAKEYDAKLAEFANLPEWKAYVDAVNALQQKCVEMFPDHRTCNYNDHPYTVDDWKYIARTDVTAIIRNNTGCYVRNNPTVANEVGAKIRELELQKESLLIKLAYERNLDIIKTMLAECGITL